MFTRKKSIVALLGAVAIGASAIGISASAADTPGGGDPAAAFATTTPIKHVVVIYGENVSFDHYFGTYPNALNLPGEPAFHALPGTPSVNGLSTALLAANPNEYNPSRLSPAQALTCDQNHGYTAEQSAFDGGLMDRFVQDTTGGGCTQSTYPDSGNYGPKGIVMDYYDGNTVTALWNYAQHFTLNDNFYGTQFGPSTPGAINVSSSNTSGAAAQGGSSGAVANGTDISDIDPYYDQCSNPSLPLSSSDIPGTGIQAPGGVTLAMSGKNVGDLLNAKSISWGWFEGGFTPSSYVNGRPVCGSSHTNIGGATVTDYIQHHEPFQYYASTANPMHNSPSSVAQVGISDPAGTPLAQAVNHQYDLTWFNRTLANGNMPAVSYLKAPGYQDAHAGYSDPLDEQRFLVEEINRIEQSKFWPSTAIFISYDDSDGWYDHQMGPIIRSSADPNTDTLNGAGRCGNGALIGGNDRCGVGPRIPLLVISPWARQNYVDNTFSEQASIVRFIEDNWSLGRVGNYGADASAGSLMAAFDFKQSYGHAPAIILNDATGEVQQTIYPNGETVSGGQPDTQTTTLQTTTSRTATPTTPAATPPATPTTPAANNDSGSGGAQQPTTTLITQTANGTTRVVSVKLPDVHCVRVVRGSRMTLTCMIRGELRLHTLLRVRLYRGRRLLANVARRAIHGRERFQLRLGRSRAGRYRVTVSIDTNGTVRSMDRTFRVS